jgi:hypothetical protein
MKKLLLIILMLSFLLGCTNKQEVTLDLPTTTTSNDLLPTISSFTEYDPNEAIEALNMLSKVGFMNDPSGLSVAIERTTNFIDCYDDVGALASKAFLDPEHEWSLGIVAIVDKNAATNPSNILRCMIRLGTQQSTIGDPYELTACGERYTIKTSYNEFYVVTFGTTENMCSMVCNNLQGC